MASGATKPRPRRRRKKKSMSQRKSLVIRVSAIAGGVIALGGALVMIARAAEAVRWGDRITDVEQSTKALTAGQVALANRVELMGRDIASLNADVSRAADRSDKGFQGVMVELAKINGAVAGLVEQSVRTQEQLAGVKEKAANALVQTDAIRETITEHLADQAKEKK